MIKFKQSSIENMDGVAKDVIVKANFANSAKEFLIGGSIILAGVLYLTYAAFKNGSMAHEIAEYKTMVDLGIIKE